jgi:hypothetical protein
MDRAVKPLGVIMLKKIDAILALLPFNGDKLKLSGLFLLIAQIPHILPGVDFKLLIEMVLANPTKAGLIAALIAVIHKAIKAKLDKAF